MQYSSHRLRAEEKKLHRKILGSFAILIASLFIILYVGIPIFAKVILFFSSFNQTKTTTNSTTNNTIVFPPNLDPILEATNSAYINISGLTDPEATIYIYINDEEKTNITADKDGKFLAKRILLTEGTNAITARAIKDKVESNLSSVYSINFIKNPPKLEILQPNDNQKYSSDVKDITITGQTDPGSKVTINDRVAIVDNYGKFSYPVSLNDGENSFKIVTTDPAGNQTTIERKVTYSP